MKLSTFAATYRRPELRQLTVDGHNRTITLLLEHVGGRKTLSSLQASHIHSFVAGLHSKGLRKSTVAKHARYAHAVMAHAVRMGYMATNPCEGIWVKLPFAPKEWQHVSSQQALDAIAATPDARVRTAVALCRWAGCRINEALRMRWDQVDMVNRTVLIEPTPDDYGRIEEGPKGKLRTVPMSPELWQVLTDNPGEGRICGNLMYSCHKREVGKVATWKGQPWHTLRKSCGMDWADVVPISTVAEWMGHSVAIASKYYLKPHKGHFAAVTGI